MMADADPWGVASSSGDDPWGVAHAPIGAGEAALEGAVTGLSANWGDEIAAAGMAGRVGLSPGWRLAAGPLTGAMRLAYEHFTGENGPASQEYDRAIKQFREHEKAAREQHPYAFGAGALGGAAATMFAAPGAAAETWGGRMFGSAASGAGYGALAGAGEGETTGERAAGAGIGAVTGAGLGAAGSAAGEVLAPVASKITNAVRGVFRPEEEAMRRTALSHAADIAHQGPSLTPEELAALHAAGTPQALIDQGGERMRALARSAANTSPEARAALNEMIQDRFKTQSPRIAQFIRDITGGADAGAETEALEKSARKINGPAYRRAYDAVDEIWNPELERLAGTSPAVQQAMAGAITRGRDRAAEEGFGAFNPGVRLDQDGSLIIGGKRLTNPSRKEPSFWDRVQQEQNFGTSIPATARPQVGAGLRTYPTTQFWDYVQREMRDAATSAKRSGRNEEYSVLTGLRQKLLGEIDKANPDFAAARQGAAQFFGAENMLDAGRKFVATGADIGQAKRALAKMSAPDRELFARGYASQLADVITRPGVSRNILNSNYLSSPAAQQKMALALGPNRAKQLEVLLHAEGVVDRARTAMGNSSTIRQMAEMGLAGGAADVGLESLMDRKLKFDPGHVITSAITGGFTRHGINKINSRLAQRIGEMLASNDTSVLRKGAEIAARTPGALKALRGLTQGAAAAGTEAIEGPQGPSWAHPHFADGGAVDDDVAALDRHAELARTMTHQAPQTSPADPYIQRAMSIPGRAWESATALPRLAAEGGLSNEALADPDALARAARASFDTASAITGGAATGAERGALGMGIRAYHGSPHDFERFDISKIGTGEGNQAYGRGLYFGEAPETAESYRTMRGTKGHGYEVDINAKPEHFLDWDRPLSEQSEHVQNALKKFKSEGAEDPRYTGQVAHAAIGAQAQPFLRKLFSQSATVENAPVAAAQALREAGIPGIRYLDQGSRQHVLWDKTISNAEERLAGLKSGSVKPMHSERLEDEIGMVTAALNRARFEKERLAPPTSNYVVFDDKMIDILKKYGMAGLAALPATGAYHFQHQDGARQGFADGGAADDLVAQASWFKDPVARKIGMLGTDEVQKRPSNFAKRLRDVQGLVEDRRPQKAHGGRVPGELTEANKASHAEVRYTAHSSHRKQRCDLCTKFISAEKGGPACKKIQSPIAASGWCTRFVLK